MKMPIAIVPTPLGELWLAVGVILGGWLLVLLGNLVFGQKKEGGKRLLVFIVGCLAVVLATFMCAHFWPAFVSQNYPQALAFCLGGIFVAFGMAFLGASVFCSNETVRACFDIILRSV